MIPAFFERVVLRTASDHHVAVVGVPPFLEQPAVVVWGQRFFQLTKETAELEGRVLSAGQPLVGGSPQVLEVEVCAVYREAFVYWVVPDEILEASTVPR